MQFNWHKEIKNFEPTFSNTNEDARRLEEIRVSIERDKTVSSDSPIKKKMAELSEKFSDLKERGDKATDELKSGAKRAWMDFQHSVERASRDMRN